MRQYQFVAGDTSDLAEPTAAEALRVWNANRGYPPNPMELVELAPDSILLLLDGSVDLRNRLPKPSYWTAVCSIRSGSSSEIEY